MATMARCWPRRSRRQVEDACAGRRNPGGHPPTRAGCLLAQARKRHFRLPLKGHLPNREQKKQQRNHERMKNEWQREEVSKKLKTCTYATRWKHKRRSRTSCPRSHARANETEKQKRHA